MPLPSHLEKQSALRISAALCLLCGQYLLPNQEFAAQHGSGKPSRAAAASTTAQVDRLCDSLRIPVAATRVAALKELAALGARSSRAVPAIIDVLNDNRSFGVGTSFATRISPLVTDAAIDALSKIGPAARDASPYLVSILEDRNELFRRSQVIAALSSIGVNNSATKTVIEVVKEEGKFTATRLQAIRLLGIIDPAATGALELLKDIAADQTDPNAKKAALESISSITSRAKAEPAEQSEQSAAVLALQSALEARQNKDALIETLSKVSKLEASAAALVPKLIHLLGDIDADVQDADVEALMSIGPKASSATPALITLLFKEKDEHSLDGILRAIVVIDPLGKMSVPLLTPALDDPFKMSTALRLLDALGTDQSTSLAAATRKRWHLK